ncbi:unnamed protein product [Rhizophagus irregularis]|nr:unnamed protein product [Rhizophagus irregularis]
MNHLDQIEHHVNIKIEGLEDTVTIDDLSQILKDLEIGEITSVQQRNYNNKNEWSCNLMIKTTKSIKEIENIWSIQSIKQSLRRYKFVPLDDRYIKWTKKQPVYLQLKGLQQDQDNLAELADEIVKRNAVYWKKEEGDNGSWVITVAFKSNETRENVKENQITINGQRAGGFCKICRTKLYDTTQCRYYIADYIPKSQRRFNNKQKDNRSNGQQPFRGHHQQRRRPKESEHQSHTRQYNDNGYRYQQLKHNRIIIDNNTIEMDNEIVNIIMDDKTLMDTIADQMVRMRIEEDIGTMIHKDIMDTQTNNAKTTNVDTTGPQDQTKRHYTIKGGLYNNTHNINNIMNRGSVMDVIDLTNQDMDVDSQIVSGEKNEDREIRYRNNKNNYNTNKKIDNKNDPKKYNKKKKHS